MIIQQLSVFIQNESGRLVNVTEILYDAEINISALSIAETEEYGILRMIVSDTEKAAEALRANSYKVRITDVICMITPDVPGALNKCLKSLATEGINVSYMYGYSNGGKARLIMKTSDPERAAEILFPPIN
ncbi:MAG: acetolactate synthase [Eubacteriales bacterium]|nr:acetolactate synthase [Eubacteriales bacterium]MDD4583246.1 acetolactate synthase [Eubacteriales bacterium]